jgi:TonB family protein
LKHFCQLNAASYQGIIQLLSRQWFFMSALGSASPQPPSEPAAARQIELRLDWELPGWLPSVRENLTSIFASEAALPPLTFRPGIFWRDVFVDQRLNWKSLARSYAGHTIFAGLLYVLSMPVYWHRIVAIENFHHDEITYLNPEEDVLVSEPLKPEVAPRRLARVISRSSKAPVATPTEARKRALAVMAIPKWADNTTHTIVAPTVPKILASSPIPDIVLSSPIPQAPPVAAVTAPKLVAPVLDVTPVAPPPDVAHAKLSMPALPQAAPIAPPVETNGARNLASINIAPLPQAVNPEPKLPVMASHTPPILGTVNPIAPAPDLKNAGTSELAKALPIVAQPIAPPPDATALAGASSIANLPEGAAPIAPPPDVSGAGNAKSASGSLISLNLNPIAGPPRVPDASRRGAFAGHPEGGKPGSGVPAHEAGSKGPGGDSPVPTKDELGIVAAAVPHDTANDAPLLATGNLAGDNSAARNSFLAMARMPRASLPPPKAATLADTPNALDERVFRGRKYYTMALNKPNLTSVGGSWIFRFAERGATSKAGEVTAPIPLREVDAAYPADLIRDNVQGVVILYAIIRADGSVAEVKILEGFDDRLDENARRALSAWHFAPGTRDGNPVDLEAVVRIPFRSKRMF